VRLVDAVADSGQTEIAVATSDPLKGLRGEEPLQELRGEE